MASSTQVITGPALKQFATLIGEDELVLTSKLGNATLSRVRFSRSDYPESRPERQGFIRDIVIRNYPKAALVLSTLFDNCIRDQELAVDKLLGGGEGT